MKKSGFLSAAGILERYYGQDLSKRELEIGQLAVSGIPTYDIAERMYLAVNTVKTHLKHIFRKTGTENRNDLYRKLISMEFPILDGNQCDQQEKGSRPDGLLKTAERDPLTGLLRPPSFHSLIESELAEGLLRHCPVSIVRVALESTQESNASAGWQREQMLVSIASVFLTAIRGSDMVFRWENAEFLLLLPNCSFTSARQIAGRLVQKAHALAEGRNATLGIYAGSASTEEGWKTSEELLGAAGARVNFTREVARSQPSAALAPAHMPAPRPRRVL